MVALAHWAAVNSQTASNPLRTCDCPAGECSWPEVRFGCHIVG